VGVPVLAAALLVSTACPRAARADDVTSASVKQDSGSDKPVTFSDPQARLVGEHKTVALLYFTISNPGDTVYLINKVSAPQCKTLEASSAMEEPGNPDTTLFSHLALPAKTRLVFPPGGFHLICRGLPENAHGSLPVTFTYLKGNPSQLTFNLPEAR